MDASGMPVDPSLELRFALAEGDAVDVSGGLRERVLAAATAGRPPGRAHAAPVRISGREAFRRIVARLDALLSELGGRDWAAPTAHYPAVQQVVGHLIGVEQAFLAVLDGDADPSIGVDHRAMTEPAIARFADRSPVDTHRAWFTRATASLARTAAFDLSAPIAFYGTAMPLDQLLVVRAFELWIHDEDLRRATGRPLDAPDPEVLARMVEVAIELLPLGVSLVGKGQPGRTARLVLTGSAGGTFDVNLDGSLERRPADARIVVDAAAFCRLVGNREDAVSSGALVTGDEEVATDTLVGAAAVALD